MSPAASRAARRALFERLRRAGASTPARILAALAASLILVPGLLFLAPALAGSDEAFIVLSGSMEPTFGPGDVIFVETVDPARLVEGDVVTFRAGSSTLLTHRIVEIEQTPESLRLRTQGDANEDPDPFFVKADLVVGKHEFTIPLWGHVVEGLRSKGGYLALVLIPAALVLAREFISIYRALDQHYGNARRPTSRGTRALRPLKLVAVLVVTLLLARFVTSAPVLEGAGVEPLTSHLTLAYVSDAETAGGNTFTAGDFVKGCPSTAPPPKTAPGGTYPNDPGFAFVDANCNGVYEAPLDTAVPTATLAGGTFNAGPACLVIPPSVGPILASSIDFSADGGIVLAVNLTTSSGNLKLASSARITAEGVAIRAAANIDILGGHLRLNRSEVTTSSGGTLKLAGPTGKSAYAANATLLTDGNTQIDLGADVHLTDSSMKSYRGNIQVKAAKSLVAPRVVLRTPSGNVQFDAVTGTMTIDDALLLSASGNFQPKAGGLLSAPRACLRSDGNLQVTAEGPQGAMRLAGATLLSTGGAVEIEAGGTSIEMTGANLTGKGHVTLRVDGPVYANTSRIDSHTGHAEVNVVSGGQRFYVQAARFYDDDDSVQLKPASAVVVGTPAYGTVS